MADYLKASAFGLGAAGGGAGWNYFMGAAESSQGRDPGFSIDKVGHFFGSNFDIAKKFAHIGATEIAPTAAEFDVQRADLVLAIGLASLVFAAREFIRR